MYYTYILQRDKNIYIGYSSDLKRRLAEHKRKYENVTLLYYEAYKTESHARRRELSLKQYGGAYRSLKIRLEI